MIKYLRRETRSPFWLRCSGQELGADLASGRAQGAAQPDLQVWDENADPFTIFNTLSRLRRKLGTPPLIETRPGVGYRITGLAETPW